MPRDHMERWWLDVLDDSQQSAPTTRHVSKDKWQPPPLNHAQHSSLPRWDPRHCRAETTFLHWAPYKFPCHSICEYNKRAVFTQLNFGVIGYASGRRIWLAVLFCLSPALILAAEQDRSGESLRPCGDSMMLALIDNVWSAEPTPTTVYLQTSWNVRKINKLLLVYAIVCQIICYL